MARKLYYVLVVLVLAGCATSYDQPINVTSYFNPDADYETYQTWDFIPYDNEAPLPVLQDAAFRVKLGSMIEEAMKARGLTRVFESPDLHVGYHGVAEPVTEKQVVEWWGEHDMNMPSSQLNMSDNWGKGALLLFVFDAKTGKLLWRSSAEAVVDADQPMEKRQEIAKNAIRKMLDEMPGGDRQ